MLHGNISLAVIPVETFDSKKQALVSAALACEKIDAVAVSTLDPNLRDIPGVSVRNRTTGGSMIEIVADLLSDDNENVMFSSELPLKIVYLQGDVDLDAALLSYDSFEQAFLVSVQKKTGGSLVLSKAGLLRPAYPRAIDETLQEVERDGNLIIADYHELMRLQTVELNSAIGFLQPS